MQTIKVLVIDDEPGITAGIARTLKNHYVSYPFMDEDYTFEVLEASTGEIGIEYINGQKPEILFLDNKLPGIQGTDVLQYIDKNQINVFVVMITSYASLDMAIKAKGYGAYDFIPKPFTPQELKFAIDNITKQLYLKKITGKMKEEGKQIRYQFLSVLSHELKAPLNAVEGYLKMIANRDEGDDLSAYDTIIERSLHRIQGMRHLIMDLLDLTKISLDGKKQDRIEEVNLKEIASNAISTMHPYAIQKNVEIIFNAPEKVLYNAVPDDMEIIFNNLLSNAVKYNNENGKVFFQLNDFQDAVEIIMKDTGIGMNSDDLSKLFGEFVRLKNEKTKNILGSGLGLSIIKKLVEAYDGKIDVKSEPEKGSTFNIILPK